jgi:hypothetical protein
LIFTRSFAFRRLKSTSAYELYKDSEKDENFKVTRVGGQSSKTKPDGTPGRQPNTVLGRLKKTFSRGVNAVKRFTGSVWARLRRMTVVETPGQHLTTTPSHNAGPQGVQGPETSVNESQKITMAERFKQAFSREEVRVHFVGVWYVLLYLPH